LPIQ